MQKPISTRVHGVLDYLSAGTLIILPRILNWSGPVTTLLMIMGIATLIYSLITRYELSVARLLPMKGHLALDGLSGLALIVAAFLLPTNGNGEFVGLIALGLFELGAALLTEDGSTVHGNNERGVYAAGPSADDKERAVGVYDNPSR